MTVDSIVVVGVGEAHSQNICFGDGDSVTTFHFIFSVIFWWQENEINKGFQSSSDRGLHYSLFIHKTEMNELTFTCRFLIALSIPILIWIQIPIAITITIYVNILYHKWCDIFLYIYKYKEERGEGEPCCWIICFDYCKLLLLSLFGWFVIQVLTFFF